MNFVMALPWHYQTGLVLLMIAGWFGCGIIGMRILQLTTFLENEFGEFDPLKAFGPRLINYKGTNELLTLGLITLIWSLLFLTKYLLVGALWIFILLACAILVAFESLWDFMLALGGSDKETGELKKY